DTPQVIGFLKPVILIPAACLANLSMEQVEAVLLHELVHIKRNDYLTNLLIASVEILFFFNPFVKQLTASIRKEREYCCDDMVIQFQYHPCQYASALLTLEKSRLIPVTYGIAAGGRSQQQLLTRVERILGIRTKQPGMHKARAGLVTLLLLGFLATMRPETRTADKPSPGTMLTLSVNRIQIPALNSEANLAKVQSTLLHARSTTEKYDDRQKTVAPPSNTNRAKERSSQGETAAQEEINREGESANIPQVLNVVSNMTLDFSLPQKPVAAVPETVYPDTETEEPYVPANSFSYQLVQDTSLPKIKGETFDETRAREAMVKTQKALEQIDWQAIEKELKISKQELAKLKKVITLQLKSLNWQKVNTETWQALGQEQIERLQATINQEQLLRQYRQAEIYNENIRLQLTEQEQLIKVSDEHARAGLQAAEQQQLQLQQEMKKRRIIYL
ncbi:MAG: M56 family metallopeptidase, partial [Bacteroidota bacterium]